MFTSFEQLAQVAKKVAKKVGATCHITGQQISFHRDNNSRAYLGIVYSDYMQVAYNTYSLQGETSIIDGDQLESMLRREIAIGI
jgi:hypothetical protein